MEIQKKLGAHGNEKLPSTQETVLRVFTRNINLYTQDHDDFNIGP